jgi:integrase
MNDFQNWLMQPKLAHQQWRSSLLVAERAYSVQSQRLYHSLFGKFIDYLILEHTNLQKVNGIQIAAFLDTLSSRKNAKSTIQLEGTASNRTKRTYLAEIERVLAYLVSIDFRNDNPAIDLINTLRITSPLSSRNIELLPLSTQQQYMEYVDEQQLQLKNGTSKLSIIEVQSVTMNLLMLEQGLTLKEIQKLRLNNVQNIATGFFYTPGHRVLEDRTLQLTPRSQFWLTSWIEIRKTLNVFHTETYRLLKKEISLKNLVDKTMLTNNAKPAVFVAFSGKGENRVTSLITDKIPESTIFLSAQQVLLANFPEQKNLNTTFKRKGPQILRNTFCANLVVQEKSLDELMCVFGLKIPNQIWAMQRHIKDICYNLSNKI